MPNVDRLSEVMRERVLDAQRNELTEHAIYLKLAEAAKDARNKEVLEQIAEDERRHYEFWREYTQQDSTPNRFKLRWYLFLARLLGLTFSIQLMERGEQQAQEIYAEIAHALPESGHIVEDEDRHEDQLIALIGEERLQYVGSMVLGLNDALVELTGTLAGLTLALQNTRLIAVAGLITGIAASLSMATSEYLSTKSEESGQDPLKAALYTGSAYVATVALLILPYFVLMNYLVALGVTIFLALLIILFFTFYISVAKGLPFRRRFFEMVVISFGVAVLSFFIGFLVRQVLGVDV
jgi:VIT1/CCC1 family predicted Fe2+/Mn2+ transporter